MGFTKEYSRRILSVLLTLVMVVALIPTSVIAADVGTPTIQIESKTASPGGTVDVQIRLKDNPGIAAVAVDVAYDSSILTLQNLTYGPDFAADGEAPETYKSPLRLVWSSLSNVTSDAVFATLTFLVKESAVAGTKTEISLSYIEGDVINIDEEDVTFEVQNGGIEVVNGIPGDINGDRVRNTKDLLRLRKYFSGWGVEVDPIAVDVNGDGTVNTKDLLRLRKFFAGWDVEIYYGDIVEKRCIHELEYIAYKAPACEEAGYNAYWHCTKCDKYFSNATATTETTLESLTIAATGHTPVIDAAVPATTTATGLTEGSHCEVCKKVLVAQEIIPMPKNTEYSISYNMAGNDEYLAGMTIDNSANPTTFTSEAGVPWFEEPVVPGYTFEGWYDGQGTAASRVTTIPIGTARNITLFAKWTKEVYTITFDNSSMSLPQSSMQYTVDQRVTLDKPTVDRYVFLGWTTDKDELVTEIKPGTTGNLTLHSNWTSKRNLTKPVAKLGDPIIVEDTIKGKILFTYEIGQIENVPLYTIKELPSAGGVVSVYTETVKKSIAKTDATTIAEAIDHVTTDSTAWTLSEDWNETTHIEDSVLQEHGLDRKSGQSVGKTSSNTYTLTTSEYDNTVVKANDGSVSTTTQYNTKDVDSRETWESKASLSVSDTESVKYKDSASVSAEIGVGYGPVSAKAGASAETSTEISSSSTAGASAETTVAHENSSHSKTGTDTVTVTDKTTTTTTDKGWNKSSSSASSSSNSLTEYEEKVLSEKIASKHGYGQSYAKGGTNSASADWSTSTGKSEQYSTTLTYFSSEETTEGVSYTINGESDGSYRLVRAGVVHVFGVVIYDIAKAEYGVTTYAVLDDETYTYIDYSATSAAKYDDNPNGVLPFEIPYAVNDYVNGRIVATEGLKYDESTLSTGEYEGSNTSVIIPEFFMVDNHDNSCSAYTVRHLSPATFSGDSEIKSVFLSNYIREIPSAAFAGCSSLQFVYGSEIAKIGDYAFSGCTSLGEFKVSPTVTSIGENAFQGVDSIIVNASSKDVVLGAIESGAKRITINISGIVEDMSNATLEVPDSVEYFELQGGRKTFSGLKIHSDAGTTVLNGITITDSTSIPLEISSEAITLNQVMVESPSYTLLLKGAAPTLSLYGTSRFVSSSVNAIVCRNVAFEKISSTVSAKLEVTGNLLAYGEPSNASLVSFPERGEIVPLTEDEFDKYIKGSFSVTFDANEGTVDENSMVAYIGSEIGALPIPERDYYAFAGWFLSDGTTEITSESVFTSGENVILYAHWTLNPLSDWVKASEVPDNAQVVGRKWSYNYTTNSALDESPNYTIVGSSTSWSDYGAWSNWSSTAVTGNDARQVETKWVEAVYKTQYHYYRYVNSKHNSYGTKGYSDCTILERITLDYELGYKHTVDGVNFYGTYNGISYYQDCWMKEDGKYGGPSPYTTQALVTAAHTEYRYRDRSLIYNYDLESANEPTGQSNVLNIVEWVQYRVK
ncbi:MAG: InlB B-repeat-containing protein [Paludibacteraceae bacterium]|nr:InlB B-repeat-containing protein [Paludibacteraceae bacterium]